MASNYSLFNPAPMQAAGLLLPETPQEQNLKRQQRIAEYEQREMMRKQKEQAMMEEAKKFWQSLNPAQKVGMSPVGFPFTDAIGLAGDVQMYKENPEMRSAGNYAMSGLGLLPFVPGVASTVMKKGIKNYKTLYHGSPNSSLKNISIDKSKQSEGFMPHVSVTDDPLLAQSFTKGELGNLKKGKVYEVKGDFKIIDYTTEEGKKIWKSLGQNDYERAINAKKQGYDGRRINNYEKLKIESFYPEINWKDVKDSSEIQMFKDLSVKKSKPANVDTSYRMQHQPRSPDMGAARLDDMTGGGEVFPDDIYSANGLRYYGNPNNKFDRESYEIIQKARGNPDMEITIYRAVPKGVKDINSGDFVTPSKTYAEDHASYGYGPMGKDSGDVISKKVKVKDIYSEGNDLNEFGYFPDAN